MKKFISGHFPPGKWKKTLFLMKLSIVALVCSIGSVVASPAFSQQAKIDVSYNRETLGRVLSDLRGRSGYDLIYYKGEIPEQNQVTLTRKDATLQEILNEILPQNGLAYSIRENIVTITRAQAPQAQQPAARTVTGLVTDENGRPLPGVTVAVKNTQRAYATGTDGRYTLTARPGEVLVFSFVGKKSVERAYSGQAAIDVRMETSTEQISDVVITGMFNRRLESETGSSVQFKGEQLRQAGNQNVLKSLANLDPSFMIMESLEFGSDPNRMPDIQMRGQSSFPSLEGEYQGNPNQPLFVLDGFEVSVEKIYDLDMNRVSSVTILKDASAKAIYGSKAGNGVVIIETIRPQRGELRVSYSGTFDIEAPDLTSYNLMNAEEKLAYEKSRGMYVGQGSADGKWGQNQMDEEYNALLRRVMEGVDTYWLSKPLHVGFGQKHSLSVQGGDDKIMYGIGVNYNNVTGVMKGSERNTFSGNMNFVYNHKNLIFRNTLEFTTNSATNSPYGSFSEYAVLNPYWIPYDEQGNPTVLLGGYHDKKWYNPLYNASLNTKSTSAYNEVRDNFQMEWNIRPNLKATGRFSFTTTSNESDLFYPANHTMFITYGEGDSNRKGRYTKGDGKLTSCQADFGINYNKTLGKHMFFANATWNMASGEGRNHTYTAEGFGNDNMDDIAFAAQYLTGSTPAGSSNNQREVGVIGALNYSYADRYLFDASARTSGSSMYGADQKWGVFWALGLGWNIHKEAFANDLEWLNRFKIRGSVGYTGSQNFDPYQAKARYEYGKHVYDGGYGAIILGLPNDNLRWQRVLDYNAGADIALWKKITVKFDYFITVTDDLLIDVAIPPSTGFATYKENLGKVENRGFDASLSFQAWRNPAQRGWLTVSLSGMHNQSRIKQISDTFEHRNNKQNAEKEAYTHSVTDGNRKKYTRPSTLYYEGQSMTAIWGVRSAGVDPQTGSEVFYDLNGRFVNKWSALNQVVIGDSAPKLRGNINLNAGYKGFTFSMACSYRLGGQLYNTTLVDKIENTNGEGNLDRRILQAWNKPGDVSPYAKLYISNIDFTGSPTRPTSRFVMKDRELYISSASLGYDFQQMKTLSMAGIERLRLSFFMNEIVRLSSVEVERGTSYPFARNFSLSVQATF